MHHKGCYPVCSLKCNDLSHHKKNLAGEDVVTVPAFDVLRKTEVIWAPPTVKPALLSQAGTVAVMLLNALFGFFCIHAVVPMGMQINKEEKQG